MRTWKGINKSPYPLNPPKKQQSSYCLANLSCLLPREQQGLRFYPERLLWSWLPLLLPPPWPSRPLGALPSARPVWTTVHAFWRTSVSDASQGLLVPGDDTYNLKFIGGSNFEAIQRELQRTDNVVLSNTPGLWGGLVFHCNNDHSITEVQRCPGGCVNAGAGQSDYCSSRSSPMG